MQELPRRRLFGAARTLIAALALGKFQAALADDMVDFSALKLSSPPTPSPAASFLRSDGSAAQLSDHLGKGVVLNFWATWCAPCVAELPSLDRLAASLAGSNITVLAVSEDLGAKAAGVVQKYYAKHAITHLPVLIDHFGHAADAFNNQGVPTTLLIDAKGQVKARLEGGTDWSKPEVLAKVRALIG